VSRSNSTRPWPLSSKPPYYRLGKIPNTCTKGNSIRIHFAICNRRTSFNMRYLKSRSLEERSSGNFGNFGNTCCFTPLQAHWGIELGEFKDDQCIKQTARKQDCSYLRSFRLKYEWLKLLYTRTSIEQISLHAPHGTYDGKAAPTQQVNIVAMPYVTRTFEHIFCKPIQ
jgi:hypothetical protein